jgi:hypothetical protein
MKIKSQNPYVPDPTLSRAERAKIILARDDARHERSIANMYRNFAIGMGLFLIWLTIIWIWPDVLYCWMNGVLK